MQRPSAFTHQEIDPPCICEAIDTDGWLVGFLTGFCAEEPTDLVLCSPGPYFFEIPLNKFWKLDRNK